MSNTRQEGYYWVKVRAEDERPTNWTAIRWSANGYWVYHGNPIQYPENKWLIEINETRIPSPDEVVDDAIMAHAKTGTAFRLTVVDTITGSTIKKE